MKSSILRVLALALPSALLAAACGQITGLSNDYVYDLATDGAAGDAAADAPASDGGPGDGSADSGDAGKCSVTATASATMKLATTNGTALCKSCLASSCCTTVETCTVSSNCKDHLSCELDCTTMNVADRASCMKGCNNGGGPPALYTNGVGQCAGQACKTECAFQ